RDLRAKPRKPAWSRLDQHDARLTRVDVAEVLWQRELRQFGDGAGELDAGRARADDGKGEQRLAPLGIAFAFGTLEGDQDAAAQRGGVFQGLEAGRERLPFVMTEIGVVHA